MRLSAKFLALFVSILALAVAGCGDSGSSGGSGSPLDAALSYVPKDAPFVIAIDTDVEGDQFENIGTLLDKFPLGGQIEQRLRQELERGAGNASYEDDIKPQLGNPFVVGAIDARSFGSDDDAFVGAIEAKDGDKLEQLLKDSGAQESGEQSGATLYEQDGSRFAVEGDTLIVAGSDQLLEQALARADGDDHLNESSFEDALADLPEDALIRASVDVQELLQGDLDARDARKVKWVDALRTLGLTAAVSDDGIDVDFNLETEGDLSDEDLPLAAGGTAPRILDQAGEINIGLRDLGQLVRFAENAGQSVDPAGFGQYAQAKEQLNKQLDVDIDKDLIGQLSGDVSINATVDGSFGVRAELEDPAAFERTLDKVAPVLPDVAEGAGFGTVGLAKPKPGQDFYALAQPDGDSIVFGVVEDAFVLANDPERAGRIATEEPTAVSGAKGSLVLKANARELVNQLLGAAGDRLGFNGIAGRLFTGPLGDLTGSVESSTDGLKGSFTLAIE